MSLRPLVLSVLLTLGIGALCLGVLWLSLTVGLWAAR